MKSISLYTAYCFLQQCKVVELEGRYLEPHILCYEEESDNEFLILQWEEEYKGEHLVVEVVFEEGDNQKVEVDGRKLYLVNTEGDEEEIILLQEMDLEIKSKK